MAFFQPYNVVCQDTASSRMICPSISVEKIPQFLINSHIKPNFHAHIIPDSVCTKQGERGAIPPTTDFFKIRWGTPCEYRKLQNEARMPPKLE